MRIVPRVLLTRNSLCAYRASVNAAIFARPVMAATASPGVLISGGNDETAGYHTMRYRCGAFRNRTGAGLSRPRKLRSPHNRRYSRRPYRISRGLRLTAMHIDSRRDEPNEPNQSFPSFLYRKDEVSRRRSRGQTVVVWIAVAATVATLIVAYAPS